MYLYLRLKGGEQSATATPCILMVRRPFVTQTVPVSPLFAKNDILYRFLNAQTLSGFEPHTRSIIKIEAHPKMYLYFWLGRRGSNPRNDGVKVRCLTAWLLPNNMN